MFSPKHRLVIRATSFPTDQFICLASQVISIVQFLINLTPPHTWYGADVEALEIKPSELDIYRSQLNVIGSDEELIQYCLNVDQFIWGVFISIYHNTPFQNIQQIKIKTEDPPFRPIPCKGVLIEIRMFDTSCIEVYAEDENLLKKLSAYFQHSRLDKNPNETS